MSNSYFERLGSTAVGSRVLASARLKYRALTLLHEILAKEGISQTELAKRLKIRKSAVNQTLHSDGAMKIGTFAEYLDALGYEADISVHPRGTMRLRAQMDAPHTATAEWDVLTREPEDCPTDGAGNRVPTASPAVQFNMHDWTVGSPLKAQRANGQV